MAVFVRYVIGDESWLHYFDEIKKNYLSKLDFGSLLYGDSCEKYPGVKHGSYAVVELH